MDFIGREFELRQLRQWDESSSRLTVIYGRRRIGKTRLIQEAFQGRKVYSFEGIEGKTSRMARREFVRQMAEFFSLKELFDAEIHTWPGIFLLLSKMIGGQPCVVVLDEFQWMAGSQGRMIGDLKYAWDNLLSKHNRVHLIVCGSVSSFIVKKVLRSKALYGRITDEIQLTALSLPEIASAVRPRRSIRETVELYMLTGGVPQYLTFVDMTHSSRLNIERLCFTKNGPLVPEVDRIFTSHFGRNRHYRDIVSFLAEHGWADREQLEKHCGLDASGRMTEYLDNLALAGFIEKYARQGRGTGMRHARFRLIDFYLLFYFRFIGPNLAKIQGATKPVPMSSYVSDHRYASWQGLAFERVCLAHRHLIAEKLGFGAVRYDAGSWYQLSRADAKTQIDLLYRRADNVITVCEIKHTIQGQGIEVCREVQRKIDLLPDREKLTVERVLVCAVTPSENLIKEGYFHRILTAEELFG